jgi:uncharacterized protein DUF4326
VADPERIQLRRAKGWRKPPDAIVVSRPSKYGNPFKVGDPAVPDREAAVAHLGTLIGMRAAGIELKSLPAYPSLDEIRRELAGRDLACWCPPARNGQPDMCHAALLISLANAST